VGLSAAVALAALGPLAAHAAPFYSLTSTIAIPAATSNTTGKFTGYDLSTFDPATQLFYLTDRSNNGVDIFSAKTNSFQTRIGAGLFAGATPSNDNAGPNGLTIANVSGGKLLIAGNGPSNLIAFSLGTDGVTVNGAPRTISTAVAGTAVPPNRVDGVAFAPGANTILAANNAANPGFLTLIDNATSAVRRSIVLVSIQDHVESGESVVIPSVLRRFAGVIECGQWRTGVGMTAASCVTRVT